MNYYINQKFFNVWKSKFYILNDAGEQCFEIKSDLTLLQRLTIYDMNNKPLIKIRKRYFRLLPRYDICSADGSKLLAIKSKFTVLIKKYKILSFIKEFDNITIDGNILAWDFRIKRGEEILAKISKKVLKIADSYCISINEEDNVLLYLAMVIILDCINHKKK